MQDRPTSVTEKLWNILSHMALTHLFIQNSDDTNGWFSNRYSLDNHWEKAEGDLLSNAF